MITILLLDTLRVKVCIKKTVKIKHQITKKHLNYINDTTTLVWISIQRNSKRQLIKIYKTQKLKNNDQLNRSQQFSTIKLNHK